MNSPEEFKIDIMISSIVVKYLDENCKVNTTDSYQFSSARGNKGKYKHFHTNKLSVLRDYAYSKMDVRTTVFKDNNRYALTEVRTRTGTFYFYY